jgi:iron complex transport system substrate-binding protein
LDRRVPNLRGKDSNVVFIAMTPPLWINAVEFDTEVEEVCLGSTKTRLMVLATIAGMGLAAVIHRCNESITSKKGARAVRDASSPAEDFPMRAATSPHRIAVFSSAAVELLFAIGAGDRIAGVTRYAVYPKAVEKLPKLGGLMDINFERLTALHPDLIIVQSVNPKIEEFAKRRNIEFMRIELERIEDALRMAVTLGDKLGLKQAGTALAEQIRRALDNVRRRVRGQRPVPCFLSVDRVPGRLSQLLSSGRETFLTELLELAGGRNVFGDMSARYRAVSKEALLARAPEVILELKPGVEASSDIAASLTADWKMFGTLPAVRQNRIYVITHDAALIVGPRMAEVALALAKRLHPTVFEEGERDEE